MTLIIAERDLLEAGAYETLEAFLGWVFDYGAERATVYVRILDLDAVGQLERSFEALEAPADISIRSPAAEEAVETPIQIGIGFGGKREFAGAVKEIAECVAENEVDPAAIREADIEEQLVFADEPDLMIKTGAERLSDFMIWQSVYSELYFTDVNWQNFRRRDYLRAILSYKRRNRRFGT